MSLILRRFLPCFAQSELKYAFFGNAPDIDISMY